MDLKAFGKQLQILRKQAGLSQERLAEALDQIAQTGPANDYRMIDSAVISRWEQAREYKGRHWKPTRPYVQYLIRLLAAQLTMATVQAWIAEAGYQFSLTELQAFFPMPLPVAHASHGADQLVASAPPGLVERQTNGWHAPIDWREIPDQSHFYGREPERLLLEQWLLIDHCRLVIILGMGGVGKTALAAALTRQLSPQFDRVIWRSLLNAPPLAEILQAWLQMLSGQTQTLLPDGLDAQLALLFTYLRQARCLLVLDNVESLLQGGEQTGEFRPGYEDYDQLIQRLGENEHQSCLLLTSREQPKHVGRVQANTPFMRTFQLGGLAADAGQELLVARGLSGAQAETHDLIERYSGNPLALQLIARTIQDLFAGNIPAFLHQETPIFDDIREVLDQQFRRLSPLQRSLLIWLAIEREGVTVEELAANLVPKPSWRSLLEAVHALQRRSLLEKTAGGFTLQNVVTEYVTEFLIEGVCQEIKTGELTLFRQHALCKAGAKEYVRQSQIRMILHPIAERLLADLGRSRVEKQLQHLLVFLHRAPVDAAYMVSYAAGNLLNLLLHLGCNVQGYDFSQLSVWQAYLSGVTLAQINFAGADLTGSVFTEAFHNVNTVAFSPQGDFIAAGAGDGSVALWQVIDGRLAHVYTGHSRQVWSIAFSPATALDVRLLASCGEDTTVRLWAVDTGKPLFVLRGHTSWVRTVAFSPDGHLLASASGDQTVRIWEVRTGECLFVLTGHTNWVRAVAFSPDGQLLASAGDDHALRFWDANTGAPVRSWPAHTDWIRTIAFSPDGRWLASGSNDQTVCIWDVAIGQCLHTLHGHSNAVTSVAFSPRPVGANAGQHAILASGSWDQTVRLWNPNNGQLLITLHGHTDSVLAVAFSPDGERLASGGNVQAVRVWEVCSGRTVHLLHGHNSVVRAVAFNRDDQLLAAGVDEQGLRVWDFGAHFIHPRVYGPQWFCIALSPGPQLLASARSDRTVQLWDLSSGQVRHTLPTQSLVKALAFSADDQWLAGAGHDQTITIWSVVDGRVLHTVPDHPCPVTCVALSPNGALLATGGEDQKVRLWRLDTEQDGQLLHTLPAQSLWVETLAFSPDGTLLASGGNDPVVRLWDVRTGQLLASLHGHANTVSSLAFSPDGRMMATGCYDMTVRLWDVPSGHARLTLHGHTSWIRSVAFNQQGTTVASGGEDETICLWNVDSGACLATLRAEGPYAGMNITGVTGITPAQRLALMALGAVEA